MIEMLWKKSGSSTRPLTQEFLPRILRMTDDFQTILEIDRLRADRMGIPLSLVVFTIPLGQENAKLLTAFSESLSLRLRATDHSGMVGPFQYGVLLWDAHQTGAERFIHNVLHTDELRQSISTKVYLYPHKFDQDPTSGPSDLSNARPQSSSVDTLQTNQADDFSVQPSDIASAVSKAVNIQTLPMESLFQYRPSIFKRVIDIIGASFGLLIASPLLLLAGLLIKSQDGGPIFFMQKRSGLNGKPFSIYKLRTMTTNAEAQKAYLKQFSEQDGAAFKMTNDPRVTWIGRFLRKTSIDELPQLINVIKGEMSLVGPRPLPCDEASACDMWQQRRLDVMPGLTCIWQVEGRSRVSFAEWMRMDLRYIRRNSFWNDVHLILATIPAVLLRRGAK